MAVNLDNLPQLDGWVNLTEAAEIIGITRQYSYRMAKRTNEGLGGGWQTIHRLGSNGHYVISLDEVQQRKRIRESGGNVAGEIEIEDPGNEKPASFEPSRQLLNAYSWWLAAELVRRNPHLIIHETHPGGGMYDCLSVRDGRHLSNAPTLVDINRAGRIHAFRQNLDGTVHDLTFTWAEALSVEYLHRLVDEIEMIVGLNPEEEWPPTPRSRAYELLAETLMSQVNEIAIWDVRNEIDDSDPFVDGLNGYIQQFPSIVDRPRSEQEALAGHNAQLGSGYRYWAILRNQEPVLVVSAEGIAYTRHRSMQLSELTVDMAGGVRALAAKLIHQADQERFDS